MICQCLTMMQKNICRIFAASLATITILLGLNACVFVNRMAVDKDFASEEKHLTERIASEGNRVFLADLYVTRARLRLRSDNPQVNYSGALDDLNKAVSLDPVIFAERDIRNWLAVLTKLANLTGERDQLKVKIDLGETQNRTLRSNIELLESKEQSLQMKIEELQALEFQMELRRKYLH